MHRFFVSPGSISGDAVTLSGPTSRQLARVLRSRPGAKIVVLDDSGWEYVVTLEKVSPDEVLGAVVDRQASRGEPRTRLTLYQGVLKADRFEFVLQKGTELGVSTFVPMICARSVPRMREKALTANRYARWRRIMTEAAEQSGRGRIPILEQSVDFFSACDNVEGPAIIPWEQEHGTGLHTALKRWRLGNPDVSSLGVFIGPEGGFTKEEVEHARTRGIEPVSLGERILRAETAGIAVVAAILHDLGELGG